MRSQDEYWHDANRSRRNDDHFSERRLDEREPGYYRPDNRDYPDNRHRYPEDNRFFDRGYSDRNPYRDDHRSDSGNRRGFDNNHNRNDFDWQDYDRNRRHYERHPDRYNNSNGFMGERYNEKPWGLDRLADKLERGWDRWVNKGYRDHTPDSDYSW